ncbi:MAG: fibro-slime domain-containing protein [Deltaproteobacteria bacterium]|nr:MAG: fibro-slime domain-containing protein [Deltaproteobacteria bacterium]
MSRLAVILCAFVLPIAGCSCGDDPGADDGGGTGDGGDRDGATGDTGNGGNTDGGGGDDCGGITAIVRDFDVSHSDFQDENPGHEEGLVQDRLDDERKPIYAHGDEHRGGIDDSDSFRQWYRNVDGVNQSFEITLPLTEASPGQFVFDDDHFFPLDGMGFGMSGRDAEDTERNFHFTSEIHIGFVYEGGETFTFRGDDDLWLFIDDRLVIDLGGVHGALERTIDLDDLGLTPGQRYPMDIFHAERHTSASNFRIETTIQCFVDPILI